VNEAWVCSTCKSINRQRDGQCYHCRGKREDALGLRVTASRVETAVATRTVLPYVPAWPLAAIAGALILIASLLGILILVQQAASFGDLKAAFLESIDGRLRGAEPTLIAAASKTALLAMLRTGFVLMGLLTFASWLALVTRNVPALGGGEPTRTPIRTFAYTVIPIVNLIKVPGMLQEVLYRVEPEAGGFGMVVAAWFGLVGSWIVSFVGTWMITAAGVRDVMNAPSLRDATAVFGRLLDQSFVLGIVTELMIAAGAVVLVLLMAGIERRCAIRDGEIKAAQAA
jgi:hypothetical protein